MLNKNKKGIITATLTLAVMFGWGTFSAEAKSVQWNAPNPPLSNVQTRVTSAVYDVNVSVSYGANAIDPSTGGIIPDGNALPVGSRIHFQNIAHSNTDIAWFMTGGASDSPYGFWIPGAGPPTVYASQTENIIDPCTFFGPMWGTISVAPPAVTLSNYGSAGLSCDGSNVCTITSPGTISTAVNFNDTLGRLFWSIYESEYECIMSPGDMSNVFSDNGLISMGIIGHGDFTVPQQSVPFYFTATAPPPSSPPMYFCNPNTTSCELYTGVGTTIAACAADVLTYRGWTETCYNDPATCASACGGASPTPPSCGDGTCNGTENCSTCPSDCGACPPPPPCTLENGRCNPTATGTVWSGTPTGTLCDSSGGNTTPVKSGNVWAWTCKGVCGGSPVSCTAKVNTNWIEIAP